jgi:RNA polymerase sigma-70 factor (ECF subfamily)
MGETGAFTPDTLLEHADWMRALAGYLVRDSDEADDLVQETWVASLASPPDASRPPRPWLAQVLRNAMRSRSRRTARRRARERVVGEDIAQPPSAEEVLARTQLHQRIAELMTALEEPYRTTLLLRFYEGRDSTDIGRACGVPAGTVRWRITEGLRRLRERLDERYQGRAAWRALLVPIAAPRRTVASAPTRATTGTLVKLVAAGALVTVVGGGAAVWRLRPARLPAPQSSSPAITPTTKENPTMSRTSLKRAALIGAATALPAFVAGAQAEPSMVEQGVGICVEMREKVFDCKAEFAEAFVTRLNPKPELRKMYVRKALEEIVADGSGPVEPRREKCRAMISKIEAAGNEGEIKAKIDGMKKLVAYCAAKAECSERVECMMPFLRPGAGKASKPPQ